MCSQFGAQQVVGKTNLDEWALGLTGANRHYGAVTNPRFPHRITGGSSSGSAAAVAAGLVDWALGSDTGGSIRIPAAFCGVVGLKPTFGSLPMDSVWQVSPSLDTLGILAPDVRAAGRAWSQIASTAPELPVTPDRVGDLKIVAPEGWVNNLDSTCSAAWARSAPDVALIPFPALDEINRAGLTILMYEAAQLHSDRLDSEPEAFEDRLRAALLRARSLPHGRYEAALSTRASLQHEAPQRLRETGADAMLLPATRITAPKVGEAFDELGVVSYVRPFNVTGQPVICLPAGQDLPCGVQVVGYPGREADLLRVALALEVGRRS
jgi:amidase